LEQHGINVVSTDEMTGIQALEHGNPKKPAIAGHSTKIEYEYIRHGTTTLIGFFKVASGEIITPYLNHTRTELDFCAAVRAAVQSDMRCSWVFILDGLNIHKSESLVRYVAQQCKLDLELGVKGKSGILQSMESRAEFLQDPSHRIRFVYTPKHCSWMNQIELWFSIIRRKLLKRKSYLSVAELNQSILKLIAQYNVKARPFKWTYGNKVLVI
jgi:transposase